MTVYTIEAFKNTNGHIIVTGAINTMIKTADKAARSKEVRAVLTEVAALDKKGLVKVEDNGLLIDSLVEEDHCKECGAVLTTETGSYCRFHEQD